MPRLASRFAVVSLIAAAFVITPGFVSSSDAAKRKHVEKRVADATPPTGYYGMPANYYPAPPFPFFLIPGPWWLPAH